MYIPTCICVHVVLDKAMFCIVGSDLKNPWTCLYCNRPIVYIPVLHSSIRFFPMVSSTAVRWFSSTLTGIHLPVLLHHSMDIV